jgi:antitoxin (DNA-binding transcriptional repressor) of toxin-antitoxin stability system
MTTMTVTEARAALPQLLDRVHEGEEVTITRHGRPVAVLVRPDVLRSRRADAVLEVSATIRDALEEGRRSPLAERPTLSKKRADALVEQVRAGRAHR